MTEEAEELQRLLQILNLELAMLSGLDWDFEEAQFIDLLGQD